MSGSNVQLLENQAKRTGEKRKNNQGIEMEIVVYRNAGDIDIRFETGEIVTGKTYSCFKKGEIRCPSGYGYKHLGEKRKNNQGIEMEIIACRGAEDIDIRFETGEVVTGKTYNCFKKGEIRCPSGYGYEHVGEKRKNNQGIEMEIIACRDPKHLDVRFETGEIVRDRTYGRFKSGKIRCPSAMGLKRTGEKNVNFQGLWMTVIEYRGCYDVDVRFETDDVVRTSYYQFRNGTIACPSFNRLKRIGEKNVNTHGIEMEIIEYRGCYDIDVRFETGEVVTGKRYSQFKIGEIFCPSMHCSKRRDRKK